MLVVRQFAAELVRVGSAHCCKYNWDVQMRKKCAYLFVFFELACFLPAPMLNFSIKRRIGINGQHIRADPHRMQLVAQISRQLCTGFAALCACDAYQIKEAVMDARSIQPPALCEDVGCGISFVHKAQGVIVGCLNADCESVIAQSAQAGQPLIGFGRNVCNSCKRSDGGYGRQMLVNLLCDGC